MTVLEQRVAPLPGLVTRKARSPVLLFLAGVGCVFLMACVNLANLLLVRASGRRREMQVRAALGASMGQLLGQMTAESAVLVGIGGAAGVCARRRDHEALERETWLPSRGLATSTSDGRQSGLPPRSARSSRWSSAASRCCTFGVETSWTGCDCTPGCQRIGAPCYVQSLALATQVALVVVLTVGGGLLLRSLAALLDVDPGFDARGAMAIRVDPAGRLQAPARFPFFNQVIESVEALPGVESAALTIHVPMGDRPSMGWDAIPEGREYNPATDNAAGRIVSPGYFRTMGIRMIDGRDFDSRDVRPNPFVMAINETFARRIRAEGGDPLRARFMALGNVREVVAVVADVKHRSLDGDAGREVYIPMGQAPAFFQSYDLVVRAADPIVLGAGDSRGDLEDRCQPGARNTSGAGGVHRSHGASAPSRDGRGWSVCRGRAAARRVRCVWCRRLPRRAADEGDCDPRRARRAPVARDHRCAE